MQCLSELGMKSHSDSHYKCNQDKWRKKALEMGIACDCVDIKDTFPQFKISLEKKAKDHNSSFKTYAYGRLNVIKKIKTTHSTWNALDEAMLKNAQNHIECAFKDIDERLEQKNRTAMEILEGPFGFFNVKKLYSDIEPAIAKNESQIQEEKRNFGPILKWTSSHAIANIALKKEL